MSFPKRQIEVNLNYRCSRWFDWVFGGLNFHNEHHAMPCMPRQNLRLISYDIKELMKKHEIEYAVEWFPVAIAQLCSHMKEKANAYKIYCEKKKLKELKTE